MSDLPINQGGRPLVKLDDTQWQQIDSMCAIHCTGEEIAAILKINYDTLNAVCQRTHGVGFSEYYKIKSAGGKMSLRRRQFKAAVEDGNPTMLIWLGKQWLGQTDNVDMTHHFPRPTIIKRVDGTEVVLGTTDAKKIEE